MLFETSCTHLTVTTWIKEMLLPTLRPQSLVVMDNAPFHNKPKIAEILAEHGHRLLPLPRYSPDFNTTEKAVEQSGGHLGVAEHAGPLAEAEIGGDDDAGALVELGEQVEEQYAA
jgi:hypothetical protein